jgi:hypothetical protein
MGSDFSVTWQFRKYSLKILILASLPGFTCFGDELDNLALTGHHLGQPGQRQDRHEHVELVRRAILKKDPFSIHFLQQNPF